MLGAPKLIVSISVAVTVGLGRVLLKAGSKEIARESAEALVSKGATKKPIQHTKHSLNQKINRKIRSIDELDAIKNPLKKTNVKFDSQGRPSQKFIGNKASVAVNPETGKVVTIHPTGSKLAKRLNRQ